MKFAYDINNRKCIIKIFIFFISLLFVSCTKSTKVPSEIAEIIKKNGYKIENFLQGPYSKLCKENKELAYYYLKIKLKSPGLDFYLHKVEPGENFWSIAKENGVDIDTIIAANPDLTKLLAYSGQMLIVPNKKGVIHEITQSEKDFSSLAEIYKTSVDKIKNANPSTELKIGSVFFIPDALPKILNPEMEARYEKRRLFKSPICGKGYTSLIGMRNHPILRGVTKFHNGVDIRAKVGTWVGAAAEGTVIYAGWINGYGKTIKIQHKDGYVTMYAHLSEIHVKTGQKVPAGKLIGKSGNTGLSTGPHLHFSIFKDGKVMNPLDYIW